MMKTRWAITMLSERLSPWHCLAFANQARHHYDSENEAKDALELFRADLVSRLNAKELGVREVECWSTGDSTAAMFPPPSKGVVE